jgi:hypothetical protein
VKKLFDIPEVITVVDIAPPNNPLPEVDLYALISLLPTIVLSP